MKRATIVSSVLAAVLLLVVCMTVHISAEGSVQSGVWGDLSWELNETTGVLVISGKGEMNSLADTTVWLTYSSSIRSVIIKEGVTSIGNHAFKNCPNLSEVSIPSSVAKIGYLSFWHCKGLKSITIPSTCSEVDEDAFSGCDWIETITIPAHAIRAFRFCSLKNVTISSGTSIPNSAFDGQSGIVSIVLPDSITKIGSYAFYNCSNLKQLSIPKQVTEIGNQAFYGCRSLESIAIPETVKTLGKGLFHGCSSLKSVGFPQSMREIGDNMFDGCKSLASFVISEKVERIGSHAFQSCESLSQIVIPSSVKEICDFAFADCIGLKKFVVPKGIETMSGYALDGAINLETVTIPTAAVSLVPKNSLKTVVFTRGTIIPEKAFKGCKTLESVIFCGSADEWKSLRKDQAWLNELENVSFNYHNCRFTTTADRHVGTCSECHTEIGGAHTWDDGSVTLAPSHTETGLQTHTCTVCALARETVLDKTTLHTYDTLIRHNEAQHKQICACGDEVYADHVYGEWTVVTPATEQSEGERQGRCACGKTVSESIPKLTHKHEYVDTVTPPKCTEQGYTLHTCQGCGDSYKDAYVDGLGHVYDDDLDTACNRCNALRENASAGETVSTAVPSESTEVPSESTEVPSESTGASGGKAEKEGGCGSIIAGEWAVTALLPAIAAYAANKKRREERH